jgi:hypothetical protein
MILMENVPGVFPTRLYWKWKLAELLSIIARKKGGCDK